jgi:hypothetical protein
MTADTDGCELEALSSHELHDLAVREAIRRTDVDFLWELLRAMPTAEAVKGQQHDVVTAEMIALAGLIFDVLGSGEGQIADALRPLYIAYLAQERGPESAAVAPGHPPDWATGEAR